jgi:hypothetical protein
MIFFGDCPAAGKTVRSDGDERSAGLLPEKVWRAEKGFLRALHNCLCGALYGEAHLRR